MQTKYNKKAVKNWRESHRSYYNNYAKEYRKRNPEKVRRIDLKGDLKRFGMTLENYDKILIDQNHKCPICGDSLKELKRATDHDHKTGKVRGIICWHCNTALGLFKDNPDIILNAILYLKNHRDEPANP